MRREWLRVDSWILGLEACDAQCVVRASLRAVMNFESMQRALKAGMFCREAMLVCWVY